MASGCVKIWVKVEDGKPRRATSVRVENSADIDDLIAAAFEQEKVDHPRSLVTVMFEGEKIEDSGLLVTELDTSSKNPLLLKCPDECEGV